jgi:NADPH-dependent glutamate synthase beta subunit-like oxidoreductase
MGHAVEIHEAGPMTGGMMRFGIPKYRLPRDVLDAEVKRIEDMGVVIRLNTRIDDILQAKRDGNFDAAFLAVGAHIGKRAYIPAGEAARILDAVSVLRGMEGDDKPQLGRRVLVYGGGNTALDVARTAKRLGAEPIIVYRRTREKMPAHESEVQEALDEGILIRWLTTIKQATDTSFTVEKMELDDKGFPQPTGELETIEADALVLALGQDVDLSLLSRVPDLAIKDGVVQVDRQMMTSYAGSSPAATWCRRSARSRWASGTADKPPRTSMRGCARTRVASRRGSARSRISSGSTPGITTTRPRRCSPCSIRCAGRPDSRRSSAGSPRKRPFSRRVAACRAATASNATTATACVPTTQS